MSHLTSSISAQFAAAATTAMAPEPTSMVALLPLTSFSPWRFLQASEPTSSKTEDLREWVLLGKNRMLSYSPASGVVVECVDHGDCDDDVPASTALAYAESWGLIAAIGRPLREKLTEKLAKLREAPPAKDGDAAASAPPPGLPPLLVSLATAAAAAVAGVAIVARPATSPPPAPRRARRRGRPA